jgi:hypothetical protein
MAISLPNAGACGAFLGWDEWMVAGGGMKSLIPIGYVVNKKIPFLSYIMCFSLPQTVTTQTSPTGIGPLCGRRHITPPIPSEWHHQKLVFPDNYTYRSGSAG